MQQTSWDVIIVGAGRLEDQASWLSYKIPSKNQDSTDPSIINPTEDQASLAMSSCFGFGENI
ncbi:MAG: hypothetical protein ABH891_08225 [Candidatus Omnitrophota bacterium]